MKELKRCRCVKEFEYYNLLFTLFINIKKSRPITEDCVLFYIAEPALLRFLFVFMLLIK